MIPGFPDLPHHWNESFAVIDSLNCRVWKKSSAQTHRKLIIVHGFGENSNRYGHWPNFLDEVFDEIVAPDLWGHGKSPGSRGGCEGIESFTMPLIKLAQLNGGKGCNWFGHSFGGQLSLKLLKDGHLGKFQSVVVSAPFLGLAIPPPRIKTFLGEFIEPFLGHLPLKNEIDLQILSHDPNVAPAYAADKLNHDKISPRTFVAMNKTIAEILAWKGPMDVPLLAIVPLADRLVDSKITLNFFESLVSSSGIEKKLETLPGFYHESFNEIKKQIAFDKLIAWFKRY